MTWITGSEDNDANEQIGEEDEENNFYSLAVIIMIILKSACRNRVLNRPFAKRLIRLYYRLNYLTN